MPGNALLIAICICISLFLGSVFAGAKQPFRCAAAHLGLGGASLLAVNLSGLFTGVSLPLSLLHILVSLGGGPAGTALLLLIRYGIL